MPSRLAQKAATFPTVAVSSLDGDRRTRHREPVLVFYVDKRERMIAFADVAAALARVVVEVDRRAWQRV